MECPRAPFHDRLLHGNARRIQILMRISRSAILLLNRTPLSHVFRRLYALGLRQVMDALAKQPAIYAILGCGSYFQGQPTFGISDIDLIIVFREDVKRTDAAPREA